MEEMGRNVKGEQINNGIEFYPPPANVAPEPLQAVQGPPISQADFIAEPGGEPEGH